MRAYGYLGKIVVKRAHLGNLSSSSLNAGSVKNRLRWYWLCVPSVAAFRSFAASRSTLVPEGVLSGFTTTKRERPPLGWNPARASAKGAPVAATPEIVAVVGAGGDAGAAVRPLPRRRSQKAVGQLHWRPPARALQCEYCAGWQRK